MATSSESSDDDLDKFASIANIVDSEVKNGASKSNGNIPGSSAKPSLRHWQEKEDLASTESNFITPELRHHVAKKLSKFLDSNLIWGTNLPFAKLSTQTIGHVQNGYNNTLHEGSGIKLLLTSRKRLSENFCSEVAHHTARKSRELNSISSGSDTDEEELSRLAEAAVSGHSIIQNSSCKSIKEVESKNIDTSSRKREKGKKKEQPEDEEVKRKRKLKKSKKEKHKT
ncbi:protein CUSTOS-like [Montipora foliosa]|uniref:protein CUSTOS-like n=1 Tax=Montipora foliosa TaxID=591990 RepID=UPI0035F12B41